MKVEQSKSNEVMQSSVGGVLMRLLIQPVIHPLHVVRSLQQAQEEGSCHKIAAALYQKNGGCAFFEGLSPKLLHATMKQGWVWPVIVQTPKMVPFENPLAQQAATGVVVAVIDATLSTPLERAQIGLIVKKKNGSWKEGWKGYWTHLSKLSVCWSTFLVGRKYFHDRIVEPGKKASLSQLLDISFKTTLLVSVISAPFDIANTQKIANNVNFLKFYREHGIRKMFRGSPLNFSAILIQNVASVVLLDQLENR